MKKYGIFTIFIFLLGILVGFIASNINNENETSNILATSTKREAQILAPTPSDTNSNDLIAVVKIIDGDTIVLETGEIVRYIGIDSAEKNECFSQQSTLANTQLVQDRKVKLEGDISERDRYLRLLRYVYVDGVMVNDYLVRHGFARAYPYPPDTKFKDQFAQAQVEAQQNNLGLWNDCKTDVLLLNDYKPGLKNSYKPGLNSGGDRDCRDFKTHAEAQGFFESQGPGDLHRLDSDGDGSACESLP